MRLKQIRDASGITQVTLSKLLNIARGTYSVWEVENNTIPIKRLNDFCNVYNVSIDYALDLTDLKNYPENKSEINIHKSKERLKAIRKEHRHTQSFIAEKLSIDRSLISKYEKGEYLISTTFLLAYAKLYHISCDYLLGKIDEKIELREKIMA